MAIQQGRGVDRPRHALLPTPGEVLEQDAAADGIPARWAWTALTLPFAGVAVFAVLFLVARPFYYSVQREDHPIEWAQFTLCAFTCAVSLLAAWRYARRGKPGMAALMLLAGLGMLMLAGEEISWGQRVFGLVTPAELGSVNHQSEMNLHNIDVGVDAEDMFKIFEVVMGVVAAALALVARPARARPHRTVWWLLAPPLFTLPGFVAIAAYRGAMMLADVNPLVAFQEFVELTLYFSLALTAVCYSVRASGVYLIDLTGEVSARRVRSQHRLSLVPLVTIGVVLVAVTIVFAIMTSHSGILPGNLPGMQNR